LERRLDDERLLTGAAPDAFKSLLGVIPTGFVAYLSDRLLENSIELICAPSLPQTVSVFNICFPG
jgi:hypothetical protein